MDSRGNDNRTERKETGNLPPDPVERVAPTGWLDALNTFLERAMKADLDTGC